jgi:hypothetical protein
VPGFPEPKHLLLLAQRRRATGLGIAALTSRSTPPELPQPCQALKVIGQAHSTIHQRVTRGERHLPVHADRSSQLVAWRFRS